MNNTDIISAEFLHVLIGNDPNGFGSSLFGDRVWYDKRRVPKCALPSCNSKLDFINQRIYLEFEFPSRCHDIIILFDYGPLLHVRRRKIQLIQLGGLSSIRYA